MDNVRFALKAIGAAFAGVWGGLHPLLQALVLLMILDSISGFAAAYSTRTLDSGVSFRGMAKKALILCLVAAAAIMERMAPVGVPLGAIAAGFYCAHELLSITENAVRAGLPIPKPITQAIARLNDSVSEEKPQAS